MTADIAAWILTQIAAEESAARAVPPLEHNYDMGGNRQDERWIFGRTLPSSADGMGNWSRHRDSPTTRAHFERQDPAATLARCAALREVVALHSGERPWCEDGYREGATHADVRGAATLNGKPYGEECPTLRALASAWAGADGWDERWAAARGVEGAS